MKTPRPKKSGNMLLCANCRQRETFENSVKWYNDFQEFLCDTCVTEYARDAIAQEEASPDLPGRVMGT